MPARAVQKGPNGSYVFVIKPDKTAEMRTVEVLRTEQGVALIGKGLAAGERVVVDGQYRLEQGTPVAVRPEQGAPRAAAPGGGKFRMNISQPFITRPIATSLLMLGIVAFGLTGYNLLPVAALPTVDFPTISVTASLPGASPETMASSVATPLEQQFAAIPGLGQMTSTSGLGGTSIALQFVLSRNIDGAAQDVQTAINAAGGLLPKNLPNPPTYRKDNPTERAILIYAVHSDTLPMNKVDDYAYTILAQKMSAVSGVSQVDMAGQQKFAVRVQVDPKALAARGIGLEDVRNALANTSTDQPKGNLENDHQAFTLDTNDQLFNARAFNQVIVAYRNGAPVRIQDIGGRVDSV